MFEVKDERAKFQQVKANAGCSEAYSKNIENAPRGGFREVTAAQKSSDMA